MAIAFQVAQGDRPRDYSKVKSQKSKVLPQCDRFYQ
jgi:hypothetical protein